MSGFIDQIISKNLNTSVKSSQTISGGCINNAYKIETDKGLFFIKWNKKEIIDMFRTEEKGLKLLNNHSPVHSPKALSYGEIDNKSYLLTEWIEKGVQKPTFWESFGRNMARQHKVTWSHFGLDHDNYIGSLPQSNAQHKSWHSFFIEERLKPPLNLGASKGLIDTNIQHQFDILFNRLEELIPDEPPALLHGDLWSGNFMTNNDGKAAIFDPAVHYGHRETELAFTQLFGGFSPDFYSYYNQEYPLEPEFKERVDIHNLYPLLVHINLFGNSYLSGIIQTLRRFS